MSNAELASTCEVLNQSTPLSGHNVCNDDRAPCDVLAFRHSSADEAHHMTFGVLLGGEATQTCARLVNVYPPSLYGHDRVARRASY